VKIEEFVTLWVKSGLCVQNDAEELVRVFKEECRKKHIPERLGTFCSFLFATERITEWQCEKLRMRKWKGFYLDDYVLLEQSGKGWDYSSYKSRDTRDGRIVNLIIKPMNQTGGRIEYRVEPWTDA
jgi:hypothetical protein